MSEPTGELIVDMLRGFVDHRGKCAQKQARRLWWSRLCITTTTEQNWLWVPGGGIAAIRPHDLHKIRAWTIEVDECGLATSRGNIVVSFPPPTECSRCAGKQRGVCVCVYAIGVWLVRQTLHFSKDKHMQASSSVLLRTRSHATPLSWLACAPFSRKVVLRALKQCMTGNWHALSSASA